MKNYFNFLAVALIMMGAGYTKVKAQVYMGEKSSVVFFSTTPMEDIKAENTSAKPVLNTQTGDFAVKAAHTLFNFKSALMQEHYNENYMESEKYPFATFTGKINEKVDYTKDGVNNVTVTGTLNMHGVDQPRTIKGTITVAGGKVILDSKFDVRIADHKIKVPSLYVEKIAETVEVTFHSEMAPYKKP